MRIVEGKMCPVDRSQRAWLTGDLTNHNAESAILPDKQIRHKSINFGGLKLEKLCVLTSFRGWNKIHSDSDVHFVFYVNMKRRTVHVPLELRRYSDLSRRIKEPQNSIDCMNFLKFHTRRNLLCLVLYFVLRDNMLCSVRAAWLVGHSNSN